MRLPDSWEKFLTDKLDLNVFYGDLQKFLNKFDSIMPVKEKIFHVFTYMEPADVTCVLFGEDPYPRITSACGVAFWDKEINSWEDKTNGNSLKNIFKALLVHKGDAVYSDSIEKCRGVVAKVGFKSPPQLFEFWLKQGILLINTAMTFSTDRDKKAHRAFWKNFHEVLIQNLNKASVSPFYILWGRKAQSWEKIVLQSLDNPNKIIKHGHPTFIHQFMDKNNPTYSPFSDIVRKTRLKWL